MKTVLTVAASLLAAAACGPGAQFGTVEFGDLTVRGEVDGDYLLRQLEQLDPPFEACYVQALRRSRATEGQMQFAFRGGGGRLVPEVTSDETDDAELSSCVTGAIAGLAIIEPPDAAPWDFTAGWSVRFALVRRE